MVNHTACDNMDELKRKVEALLFSSGKYVKLDELAKLCRANAEDVQKAVSELVNDYSSASSSLMVVSDRDSWKLTVRELFVPVVRRVVAETELTKTVMETLAVIAWKAPVLQSDIIKVRTNKAYDHIADLEEQGFIAKKKYGRTFRIDLAQKFYNYFDVRSKDDVKGRFARFDKLVEERQELSAKDLLDLLPKPYPADKEVIKAASHEPSRSVSR